MFIRNFECLNTDNLKLVDNDTKNYIQSHGILPLSYDEKSDLWAFAKSPALLYLLRKGESRIERS